jgi:DNA-binding transcriptional regulator YiaG
MRRLAYDLYIWRHVYRLNQQAAADLCNVSLKTWQRWERGESHPGEDNYNTVNWIISQPPPWWDRRAADD